MLSPLMSLLRSPTGLTAAVAFVFGAAIGVNATRMAFTVWHIPAEVRHATELADAQCQSRIDASTARQQQRLREAEHAAAASLAALQADGDATRRQLEQEIRRHENARASGAVCRLDADSIEWLRRIEQ